MEEDYNTKLISANDIICSSVSDINCRTEEFIKTITA